MDPNNTQPVSDKSGQPNPGVVVQENAQPVKIDNQKPKKNNAKVLIISLIVLLGVGGIAVAAILILNNNKKDDDAIAYIDYEKEDKIGMDDLRAINTSPTNYTVDPEVLEKTNDKAAEYLDVEDLDTDALREYFKKEINAELKKNKTDDALKLLWREEDVLRERGFDELALQVLLEMDQTKLVKFQKIHLYREIVSMAVLNGNSEIEEQYSKLVLELDPPEVYDEVPVEDEAE